jgi:hypothetical protein
MVGSFFEAPSGTLGSTLGCIIGLLPFAVMGAGVIGGVIFASRPVSEEHADLTKQRKLLQEQFPEVDPNKSISPTYKGQSLSELNELRDARQSFIQRVMGDTDEDYDYDMVFLED